METKNCPYCGEEILTTAKKCKHCGEWVDLSADITTQNSIKEADARVKDLSDSLVEAEAYKEDTGYSCMSNIFFTVIFVVAAIILKPSETTHINKVKEKIIETYMERNQYNIANDNKTQYMLKAAVDNQISYKIKDYIIFNMCEVEDLNTGEKKTCSIGAFGFVYVATK